MDESKGTGSEGIMSDTDNLAAVQRQFRRQAEAYSTMPVVTDPALLNYIFDVSKAGSNDRVLDVASGPGYVAMTFAPHCSRVVAIDATDRLANRARGEALRRGLTNLSFVLGNVERMPFAADSFDVAACRFAFHHFAHPDAVLAEMRRVIRGGGTAVIVDMIASEDRLRADLHNRIERLCDPSHARALPASEFQNLFSANGFDLVLASNRTTSYTVDEWIAHGGPSVEDRAKILELMESSLDVDKTGLAIRRENGDLVFSHTGATYVLRKLA
jgi:ubiquinone/menaquinone biosynthesis C-methylase UbiE